MITIYLILLNRLVFDHSDVLHQLLFGPVFFAGLICALIIAGYCLIPFPKKKNTYHSIV